MEKTVQSWAEPVDFTKNVPQECVLGGDPLAPGKREEERRKKFENLTGQCVLTQLRSCPVAGSTGLEAEMSVRQERRCSGRHVCRGWFDPDRATPRGGGVDRSRIPKEAKSMMKNLLMREQMN